MDPFLCLFLPDASGYDTVEMKVVNKLLAPGMKYGHEAELPLQPPSGVGRKSL